MNIMLTIWALPVLLAIALLLSVVQYKKMWFSPVVHAEAAAALLLASLPFLWVTPLTWPTKVFLLIMQIWILILPARFLFGRLGKSFIYSSTRLNLSIALTIIAIVLILAEIQLVYPGIFGDYHWRIVLILTLATVIALAFLRQLLWTFKHYKLRKPVKQTPLKELPTVSLCIPARNENHALQECLNAALASDYPKLETIVLDDCSYDKTSQIIKSFAHDGVRFIKGEAPTNGWLGKNQAMDTLAQQATGQYLIFASVDTRLTENSITQLVQYSLANSIDMITVLPQTNLSVRLSTLLSSLQYFWQIVLPITKKRVPVSSKCWIIKREALRKLGGFSSVKRKIVPEGSFARRLTVSDKYRFIVSNAVFGVTTAKKWSSQLETSLRLLYPTLKRQPFYVFGALILIMGFLLAPFVFLLTNIVYGNFSEQFWLSIMAVILLLTNYALVLMRTHPRSWWLAVFCLPIVLVQEMIILVASMLAYEFGSVNWKGRNICYPVIDSSKTS